MTAVMWVQTLLFLIQAAVLAWTACLIKRYTDETSALRKATERYTDETAALRQETARQNRIALRPIVLPDFRAPGQRTLHLRNCGVGCALNVTISPVQVPRGDAFGLGPAELRFTVLDYLPPSDGQDVYLEVWADGQRVGAQSPLDRLFLPQYPGPGMNLEVRFEDVESQKYRVEVKISGSNAPGRQVNIGRVEEVNIS